MEEILKLKQDKLQEIINSARIVFYRDGLVNSRMVDIAIESGFSRRTIYRYGKSKEELALLVVINAFREWKRILEEFYSMIAGNGYEQLSLFLSFLINSIDEMKDSLSFTSDFDHYFSRGRMAQENSSSFIDKLNIFRSISNSTDTLLETILNQGIEDGSIRTDIEVKKTALSIAFTFMSIAQRLTVNRELLIEETNSLILEVLVSQKELYLDALKNG